MTDTQAVSLIKRLAGDSTVTSFDRIGDELQYYEVTPKQIINRVNELMQIKSLIEAALSEYTDDAHYAMLHDEEVPGFKMKRGNKSRKVTSIDRAYDALEAIGLSQDAITETKLIGIPAMEKLMKAKGMSQSEIDEVLQKFVLITEGKLKPVLI